MLAQQAGNYREHQMRRPLRDHFACVWINRLPEPSPSSIVVVPDGAIDPQRIDRASIGCSFGRGSDADRAALVVAFR